MTRSGILGDTSVHAFAGGLDDQILFFILFFTISSVGIIQLDLKIFLAQIKMKILHREFVVCKFCNWLFPHSKLHGLHHSVINKVFGTQMAPPLDAIALYNSWQTPFAVIIILLIAITQYLSYGKTDLKKFLKQISFDHNNICNNKCIDGVICKDVASHILYSTLGIILQPLLPLNSGGKIMNGKWNASGSKSLYTRFCISYNGCITKQCE